MANFIAIKSPNMFSKMKPITCMQYLISSHTPFVGAVKSSIDFSTIRKNSLFFLNINHAKQTLLANITWCKSLTFRSK